MPRRVMAMLVGAMAWAALAAPAHALLCTPFLGCTCTVTPSDVDFGPIQPLLGQAATATGDIDVQCTGVIDIAPAVSAKIGPSLHGPIANRGMQSQSGVLMPYNLYSSTLYTTILGEGAGGFPRLTISGGLLALGGWTATAHIYGRAPAAPLATPGDYQDTITVTIEW